MLGKPVEYRGVVVDGSGGCADGGMIVGNGLEGKGAEVVGETWPG